MSTYRSWYRSRVLHIFALLSGFLLLFLVLRRSRHKAPLTTTNPAEHDIIRIPTAFASDPEEGPSHPMPRPIESLGELPSNSRLQIVISHFEEEPFWIGRWLASLRELKSVSNLRPHVTIYTKSNKTTIAHVKEASTADLVVALPNVGREGGSYLYHILSHWDELPDYILFTQAQLKKAQQTGSGPAAGRLQEWLVKRLDDQFVGESTPDGRTTGFMSLDRKHDIGYCGHFTDLGNRDEFYPLWPQISTMISGRPCAAGEPSVVSFNGHFIVSRKRIRSRSRMLYEYLQSLVDAGQGHWIHREKPMRFFQKRFGHSTPSNPLFGHTLERLWHVLFDCANINEVKGCNVDEDKAEGSGGCFCMDDVGEEE